MAGRLRVGLLPPLPMSRGRSQGGRGLAENCRIKYLPKISIKCYADFWFPSVSPSKSPRFARNQSFEEPQPPGENSPAKGQKNWNRVKKQIFTS
jgi:hypothetical protein